LGGGIELGAAYRAVVEEQKNKPKKKKRKSKEGDRVFLRRRQEELGGIRRALCRLQGLGKRGEDKADVTSAITTIKNENDRGLWKEEGREGVCAERPVERGN